MFNETIVATLTAFSGTNSSDKNGEPTVMFQCSAGRMPNRNTIAGTVAKRAGFEVGKTYLVQVREVGIDEEFGPQYTWIKLDELHGVSIVEAQQKIGEPEIIHIDKPNNNYERKSIAIEGQTTQRIKEGKFKPSYERSVDHHNAKVVQGSSTQQNELPLNKQGVKK